MKHPFEYLSETSHRRLYAVFFVLTAALAGLLDAIKNAALLGYCRASARRRGRRQPRSVHRRSSRYSRSESPIC